MKKTLATPLIALLLVGCGGAVDPQVVVSVEVTPTSLSLVVGEEATLSAVAKNAAGSTLSVTIVWTTNSPNVATVSNSGVVKGVGVCDARVTAHAGPILSNQVPVTVGPGGEARSAAASSSSCGG